MSDARPSYEAVSLLVHLILAADTGSTSIIVQGLTLSERRTSSDQPSCTGVDKLHHTNVSSELCLNEVQWVLE